MNVFRSEFGILVQDLKEWWWTLTYELREALLDVINPLPYIVLLLVILSIGNERMDVAGLLFILSIIIVFCYLMLMGAISAIRGSLVERKESIPEAKNRYVSGPWFDRLASIIYDSFLDHESSTVPISEHSNRPYSYYFVFAIISLIRSIFAFCLTAVGLAWLLSRGDLMVVTDAVNEFGPLFRSTLSITAVELLIGFIPIFGKLTLSNQVFVIGILGITGFVFLNGARCLLEASDELHRRALRSMVNKSPFPNDELLPLGFLVGVYLVTIYII